MASPRRYADLIDINYFDWASSLSQQDPFNGVDIDGFVASLMKSVPASKCEKFGNTMPSFNPRMQEPECLGGVPAAIADSSTASLDDGDDEFNAFLNCGTCFVPVLDLSPDEHGVTVNTYGSTGVVDAGMASEDQPAPIQPVLLKPVAGPETERIGGGHQAEFRQLVDCPTCFVPSSDLSPDEHGTMVNTRATRTNAALQSAIPEPEFLAYEPLEEDFLPLSPLPCEDEPQDWCATMTMGEPAPAVSSGLYDPFSALWDRVPARPVSLLPLVRDTYDSAFAPEFAPASQVVVSSKPPPPRVVQVDTSAVDARGGLRKKRLGDDIDTLCNDDESSGTRNLCPRATRILKDWMTSPEHFDHPYPDEKEKLELAAKAGITTKQLTIWFTNARKRLWVPMRKRQGLPIIGFAEYRTEQKKRYIEEQQRGLKERKPAGASPVSDNTPAGVLPQSRVQPVIQNKMTGEPRRFVVGDSTFDTGLEPIDVVMSKMENHAKSLAAERRSLAVRMLQLEQQERTLRAALQSLKM